MDTHQNRAKKTADSRETRTPRPDQQETGGTIDAAELVKGNIPPWVRRFVKSAGRGINRYRMIKEHDTVLLGISGGKDSLALALALSLRKTWLPIDYSLEALHIDWEEYPVPPEKLDILHGFFKQIGVPLKSVKARMFPDSFNGEFNCYLCSRNRRRILFEHARDRGITKIALGHHLDDLVETSLINLCFRGEFSTMRPVQEFFSGKLFVIRPLVEVKETVIIRLTEACNLPVVKIDCPYKDTNIRNSLKPIVRSLSHIDRYTRNHIYKAHNGAGHFPDLPFDG